VSQLAPNTKFLIILMGSMGDVVRGLAVPTALKRALPNCQVTWLVEPAWAELVQSHPAVDQVIIFDRPRGMAAVLRLCKEVRKHRFDITLDLQRHLKSGLFSWLSRADRSIGVHRKDSKEGNWLFHTERIRQIGSSQSKLNIYLEFVRYLGLPLTSGNSPGKLFGFVPIKLTVPAPQTKTALIVMGSSWASKDWTAAGYYELCKKILSTPNWSVVLVGSKAQAAIAAELVTALNSPRVINQTAKTTLLELQTIIAGATVGVGPDSGPGHLCAAMGIPYVALFGPTAPERTAPYGSEQYAVSSNIGCSPCYLRRCPGLNKLCMRLISPGIVWQRMREALE